MVNKVQKTQKVQVVVIARVQGLDYVLLFMTNNKRGAFWQNITGSVEQQDEDLSAAALREFGEESGMKGKSGKLIDLEHSFQYPSRFEPNVTITETCFLIRLEAAKAFPEVTLDPHEHQAYAWKDVSEVRPTDFGFPSNYEAFQCALKAK